MAIPFVLHSYYKVVLFNTEAWVWSFTSVFMVIVCWCSARGRGEQWDCSEEDKTGQVQSDNKMDVSAYC